MLVGIANGGLIDWNSLQIIETIDEEGRLQVISEEQMFDILGFKVQEERAQKEKEARTKHNASRIVPPMDVDGAAIHVHDRIQDERVVVYDKDNPELKLEARFPSIDEFRLAVRTYVIKAKFEHQIGIPTSLRVDFQLKFQHRIGKMCSQQGKKKVMNFQCDKVLQLTNAYFSM
jgi:hypothetical protein